VYDAFAMQCRQAGQAFADHRDRDSGLQPRLHRTIGHDDAVDLFPATVAHPLARPLQHALGQNVAEVVTVDPLHFHDADAAAIDEVVHVQQVVLLNLRHAGGNFSDSLHRRVVGPGIVIACRREDFQCDRQSEVIRAAPLAQVNHALSAGTQAAGQPQVLGPAHSLAVEHFLIQLNQSVRVVLGRVAVESQRLRSLLEGRRRHGVLAFE
jgi:hypothetical protein